MDPIGNGLPSILANAGGGEPVSRGAAIMQSMQSPLFNIVFVLIIVAFIMLYIYLRKKSVD